MNVQAVIHSTLDGHSFTDRQTFVTPANHYRTGVSPMALQDMLGRIPERATVTSIEFRRIT